jgi:hypothetical protein
LQLRERLISNPAALGLEIDSILGQTQTTSSPSSRRVLGINRVGDDFMVQSDYILFLGLGFYEIGLLRCRRRCRD